MKTSETSKGQEELAQARGEKVHAARVRQPVRRGGTCEHAGGPQGNNRINKERLPPRRVTAVRVGQAIETREETGQPDLSEKGRKRKRGDERKNGKENAVACGKGSSSGKTSPPPPSPARNG